MKLELDDNASEFGDVVREALGAAGGDELMVRAERVPGTGEGLVGDVLAPLGVWDLDVQNDPEELEAAAACCRAVGWWAAPGSVPWRLAAPSDLDAQALVVIGGPRPAAPMLASELSWVGVDLDGMRYELTPRPSDASPRSTGFVVDVDLVEIDRDGVADAVSGMLLGGWMLLGMLDRALALTVDYVGARQQFGRPLAEFQSVQFQLTEAEVERVGFEELMKYSLWSHATGRPEALVDALAARLAGLEAAGRVMRICHQLHGAIGFCDETVLSWLSRYSRPLRTLPMSESATRHELVRRAGRAGLHGIYGG